MDSRSPHRDFHIDFPLRQIEAATRRFALEASSTKMGLLCADPFALDVAVTIAVDVRWTDCGDDECLMVHVPLPQLKEYVAYLAKAAEADLLAAN